MFCRAHAKDAMFCRDLAKGAVIPSTEKRHRGVYNGQGSYSLRIVGKGTLLNGGQSFPMYLYEAEVKEVDPKDCLFLLHKESFWWHNEEEKIYTKGCTVMPFGTDAVGGGWNDSGGPVFVVHEPGSAVCLYGAISLSRQCGKHGQGFSTGDGHETPVSYDLKSWEELHRAVNRQLEQ